MPLNSAKRPVWVQLSPLLMLLVMNVLAGCSQGKLRLSTRTVVGATVDELADDRERLAELLRIDIEDAARDMARGLVDGGVDALGDEERQQRIHALTEEFVERVTKAAEDAGARLGPQIRAGMVQTIDEAMDEALSSEHRRDAASLGKAVASATTKGFSQELEKGLDENIVPALRRALDDELGPGLNKMLVEQVNPALAATAHDMTAAALKELNRSMREDMSQSLKIALFDPLEKSLAQGKATAERWLVLLAGALAILGVILAIVLVWYRQQWVRADETAGRRRETVRMFAEAIANARRHGTIEDYCNHIKALGTQPDHAKAYAELQEVLSSNPRLKLDSRDKAGPGPNA